MDHHVINISHIIGIFLITEPCKALCWEPYFERTVTCHQYVYSQIELLASNEQRLVNVPWNHISFLLYWFLTRQLWVIRPLLDLLYFVYQENTFSLSSRSWLHNPCGVGVFLKFLTKNGVVTWQNISHRHDVHVEKTSTLIFLSDWIILFLHVLFESLDILHHEILTSQLEMVWEMIQKPLTDKFEKITY